MSSMTSSLCSAQTTFASKARAWNFIVLGLPDDVICDVFHWRHSWSNDVTIAAFDVGDRVTLNSIIHEDTKGWSMEHGSLSLTASIDTCRACQGRLALSKSRMPWKLRRRARTHTTNTYYSNMMLTSAMRISIPVLQAIRPPPQVSCWALV